MDTQRFNEISYLYLCTAVERNHLHVPQDEVELRHLTEALDTHPEHIQALWNAIEANAKLSSRSPEDLQLATILVKLVVRHWGIPLEPIRLRQQASEVAHDLGIREEEAHEYAYRLLREILDDTFPEFSESPL